MYIHAIVVLEALFQIFYKIIGLLVNYWCSLSLFAGDIHNSQIVEANPRDAKALQ